MMAIVSSIRVGALSAVLLAMAAPVVAEFWQSCGTFSGGVTHGPASRVSVKSPRVRRLGDLGANRDEWSINLPNDWDHPQPLIERFEETRDGDRMHLSITVLNDSPYESQEGGITISFPELTDPAGGRFVERVEEPFDTTAHVIPAGQSLFNRAGRVTPASYLMVELQGSWLPNERRTLRITIASGNNPVRLQFRSTLADRRGRYYNTPQAGRHLDQQEWPVVACIANANRLRG